MQEMFSHLQEILNEFPEHVIIGGIAASLLGVPRSTADVDLVLLLSHKEAERVVELCERQGFDPSPEAVTKLRNGRPAKFSFSRRFSLDIRLASFSIDRVAIQRAQVVPLFGYPIRVATPEDLIVYKLARWAAIDQEDVRHILNRFDDSLDIAHLEKQVELLSREAGIPNLMQRWRSARQN